MAKRAGVIGTATWKRWLGWAIVGVGAVAAVTLSSLERRGDVYRAEPAPNVVARDRVVVEVLNGCGACGAAKFVALALRERGFDVVRMDNADDFGYTETLVIDRGGSREKAADVARSMGCGRVVQQVSTDAYLDVTVILGADGVWRTGLMTRPDPGM